jgi:hypothetical protein
MLEDLKNPLSASADKLRPNMAAAGETAFADKMRAAAARRVAQIAKGAALDAHIRQEIPNSGFDL